MRRLIISVLVAFAGLGWLAPWGLYELGLTNVQGRPTAPTVAQISPEDDALLRGDLKAPSGISVVPLSPVGYLVDLVMDDSKRSAEASGAVAASLVALDYNVSHVKNRRSIWWHLSGAALTIWITRNWTPSQVLSRAAELARQHPRQARRN
jgi:hypothetical protein